MLPQLWSKPYHCVCVCVKARVFICVCVCVCVCVINFYGAYFPNHLILVFWHTLQIFAQQHRKYAHAAINPNQAGGGPIGPQQIKAEKYLKIRSNLGALQGLLKDQGWPWTLWGSVLVSLESLGMTFVAQNTKTQPIRPIFPCGPFGPPPA